MLAQMRKILRDALHFYNVFKRGKRRWAGRTKIVREAREECIFWLGEYRQLKKERN